MKLRFTVTVTVAVKDGITVAAYIGITVSATVIFTVTVTVRFTVRDTTDTDTVIDGVTVGFTVVGVAFGGFAVTVPVTGLDTATDTEIRLNLQS